PQREQGEVAAPRGTVDHAPLWIRRAVGDRPVVDCGDVLQLGQSGPALDGIAPGRAVPGGTTIVHLDDGESGIQPHGSVGGEPVLVGSMRTAVHIEHCRKRSLARGGTGDQGMDPPAGAIDERVAYRYGTRGALPGGFEQYPV